MRTMKVRGVVGVNVSNPHTQSQRWIGKGPNGECVEETVQDHPDIREALRACDLVPCDVETAKLAGVKFDAKAHKKVGE